MFSFFHLGQSTKLESNNQYMYSLVDHLSMLNYTIAAVCILINVYNRTGKRRPTLQMRLGSPTRECAAIPLAVTSQAWTEERTSVGIRRILLIRTSLMDEVSLALCLVIDGIRIVDTVLGDGVFVNLLVQDAVDRDCAW